MTGPNAETPTVRVAYPPALRKQLADLELAHERGEVSGDDYTLQEATMVQAARDALRLDASWNDGPCPLWFEHNPNGIQSVFWKLV